MVFYYLSSGKRFSPKQLYHSRAQWLWVIFVTLVYGFECYRSLNFVVLLSFQIVPRYEPMNGQISVTIKGSNLGIKQEDIKRITVAGVPCTHQPERYSVSTRYCMNTILDE